MNASDPTPSGSATGFAAHESTRWTGKPPRDLLMRREENVRIAYPLAWFLMYAVAATSWHTSSSHPSFATAMIPFSILVVVFAGRFVVDAFLRERTTYVVTNRAAYIMRRLECRDAASTNGEQSVTSARGAST